MRRFLTPICLAAACFAAFPAFAAKSQIKDIVSIEGVRENQLFGQGLVTGLNGTGDNLRNCPMTKQMLESSMEKMGVNVRGSTMNVKNVAFVNVTARLPAFATPGAPIDISVSAACDAKSLQGGTLVVTSLAAADGNVYALAQGTVQTGAVSASGGSGSSVSRGVPTAGRIASGATVEKEVGFQLSSMQAVRLNLHNPDFTTSRRIADAINGRFPNTAVSDNPSVVTVRPQGNTAAYLTAIETLAVEPTQSAKIVIDEVNGVITMSDGVRISRAAIQQGNLTITVNETPQVSQPSPLSRGGTTQVTTQSDIKVDEEKGLGFVVLNEGASLNALVEGLNKLGVTPRDMISILQNLKRNGLIQAEMEVL